jgi:hypothetical protein
MVHLTLVELPFFAKRQEVLVQIVRRYPTIYYNSQK